MSPFLFSMGKPGNSNSTAGVSNKNSAPLLTPFAAGRNKKIRHTGHHQLVDVVNDFTWTQTPNIGRHEVPFVRMSEYKIKFNSLMQNIKYQLMVFNDEGLGAARSGIDAVAATATAAVGSTIAIAAHTAAIGTINTIGKVGEMAAGTMGLQLADSKNIASYLQPYYGLYGAEPTGFTYYMPYFSKDWKATAPKWGDTKASGGLGGMLTKIFSETGAAKTALDTALMDQDVVGAYIERPQMYEYGGNPQTVKLQLSLANTENQDDIIRNWHLAMMLTYQNLPNRTSKVFLEPPVIYEVEIPGTTYMPYAYISDLKITHKGATRVLEVPYFSSKGRTADHGSIEAATGSDKSTARWDKFTTDTAARNTMKKGLWKTIVETEHSTSDIHNLTTVETIVPDAYDIDITLTSLLPESQNLFYHSLRGGGTLNQGLYSVAVIEGAAGDKSTLAGQARSNGKSFAGAPTR